MYYKRFPILEYFNLWPFFSSCVFCSCGLAASLRKQRQSRHFRFKFLAVLSLLRFSQLNRTLKCQVELCKGCLCVSHSKLISCTLWICSGAALMGTLATDLQFCKRRTKIYSPCLLNGRSRGQSCKSLLIVGASIWKIFQGNACSIFSLPFSVSVCCSLNLQHWRPQKRFVGNIVSERNIWWKKLVQMKCSL